jgi:DNA-binding transcriptional MerR regulator
MDDDHALFAIGQLSQRCGLPVRTIRYWSDIGVLPPAGRTSGGRRLYDTSCVARLELIATLRELGLGLADVRRILAKKTSIAEVAAVHVEALDTQIRTLRMRRAVLCTVAKRRPGTQEMTLMNKLAQLSAQERQQIIDDFLAEVFDGLDAAPGLVAQLRKARPDLPDDPAPEQVDAWVELAGLVQDPQFRRRIRAMAEHGAQPRESAGDDEHAQAAGFAARVREHAGAALARGVAPGSAEGAEVLDRILAGTPGDRSQLLGQLEAGTDARAERYWQLLGIINGWPPFPAHVPAFEWTIAALRAHG